MSLELEGKPDVEMAMKRIDAWYRGDIIDRPPAQFRRSQPPRDASAADHGRWRSHKARWWDAHHWVESFQKSIEGRRFHGESFPVLWPNLGPSVYAAFHGCELVFGEDTSWIRHIGMDPEALGRLHFSLHNEHLVQIEMMMRLALDASDGRYLVGYTDLHPGMDCVADWLGPDNLCLALHDCPQLVDGLLSLAEESFQLIYEGFDAILKAKGQPSVTWMGIPSFGRMHIPSCDFATMISPSLFEQYCLPAIQREVQMMTHNVFHLDGRGVSRHLDKIMEIPEICAIQWVQGAGRDQPIQQWVPLITKIQKAGKGVVVSLRSFEVEAFIQSVGPERLFLCVDTVNEEEELAILKRLQCW